MPNDAMPDHIARASSRLAVAERALRLAMRAGTCLASLSHGDFHGERVAGQALSEAYAALRQLSYGDDPQVPDALVPDKPKRKKPTAA